MTSAKSQINRHRSWLVTPCVACLSFACFSIAKAASIITYSDHYIVNQIIPDGSSVGVSDTRTISTEIISVTGIKVSLVVAGGFNGDLYAYLAFASSAKFVGKSIPNRREAA